MKKVLEKMWKFFNSKVFVYVLVALLVLFLGRQCNRISDLRTQNRVNEQNLEAKNDSIRMYRNENNELVAEKKVFVTSERELIRENSELYKKVKAQSGKIVSLNTTVINLRHTNLVLHDSINFLKSKIGEATQVTETTWELPWELEYTWNKNNYDLFRGRTLVDLDTNSLKLTHRNTLMDFRDSRIDLTFGQKVVDGKFNVFVSSGYPGFTTESLEGVMIDPNTNRHIQSLMKRRKWFTGFSVNVGVTVGWDFVNNRPGMVVGPSFGYKIYQW